MPSRIALTHLGRISWHHTTKFTAEVGVGAAVALLLLIALLMVVRRHRDPVGRALAAHTVALGALRDSAARATTSPPPAGPPRPVHNPPQPTGVTIVSTNGGDG
jgi:hypothetical protein